MNGQVDEGPTVQPGETNQSGLRREKEEKSIGRVFILLELVTSRLLSTRTIAAGHANGSHCAGGAAAGVLIVVLTVFCVLW